MASTSFSQTEKCQFDDMIPRGIPITHLGGNPKELIPQLCKKMKESDPHGSSIEDAPDITFRGRASDLVVPLFFRCTWPPCTTTRHKLIWMKPSIEEKDLGDIINWSFQIIENGGAIRQMPASFIGSNPFTSTERHLVEIRRSLECDLATDAYPTFQQLASMLGHTMGGFFEVLVQPLQERSTCIACRRPGPQKKALLDSLRRSVMGQAIFCLDCSEKLGPQEMSRLSKQWNVERMSDLAQQQVPAGSVGHKLLPNQGVTQFYAY